jgi:hypothetical protein
MKKKNNETITTPSLQFFAARAIATAENKNAILSSASIPADIQALIDNSPVRWEMYQTFFATKLLIKNLSATGPFFLSENDMKRLWSSAKVFMVALVVAGGAWNFFKHSQDYFFIALLGFLFIFFAPELAPKLLTIQIEGKKSIETALTKLRNAIQKNRNEYINDLLGDDILQARLNAACNALAKPLDQYHTLEALKNLQDVYNEILSLENATTPNDLRTLDFHNM